MNGIGTMRWRRGVIAAVTVLASLGFASAASAATYNVTDTRDLSQSVAGAAAGTCVSTGSTCTLRSAIEAANENGGASTINLAAGVYPINSATAASKDLTTGDFKVNPGNNSTQITIVGAGIHTSVINAAGFDRIFENWPNGVLNISQMTLENGDGGNGSDLNCCDGGAIYSEGHLTASNVDFTGNSSDGDSGGAIYADNQPGSTLSITSSVFQNDMSPSEDGGAIYNATPNDATVSFTLFQANSSGVDGGAVEHGGGAAKLTLNFDEFLQNVTAEQGGAVQDSSGGDLTITNSLFMQNQTTDTSFVTGGGALWNRNDAITSISNTSFDGNSSGWKGGAINDAGSNALNLTQDKFANNTSHQEGGALELHSSSTSGTTITSSEFDANSVQGGEDEGGAIDWASLAPLTVLGSSFVLNTAEYGGALEGDAGAPLTMYDTTMSRNTATGYGGAIYMETNTPTTMFNDTIAFNNGGTAGGIAYADDFTSGGSAATGFGVENTIVAQNSGKDCSNSGGTAEPFLAATDTGNNLDSDQTCFGGLAGPNDKVGVNPLLFNPANNGGPAAGGPGDTEVIQTDAEQSSSPSVDAGNNNGCPAVDARGAKRPAGKACDIGAFEFGSSPAGGSTTSTSTTTSSTTSKTSTTSSTVTTSKTTTVTTTTTTSKPKPKPKPKKCPKGKVRKHGKCVKKHKKHKK